MHIAEILKSRKTTFSFEFFPPKTEKGSANLFNSIRELDSLKPDFVSVTYGAGGSTRELTRELVVRITKETNQTVVSHLTCVGATRDSIRSILNTFADSGIGNILALRGDPPQGEDHFVPVDGGFRNAAEIVSFIKKEFPTMGIGVAGFPEGHPESTNRLKEIEFLKQKVDAGADYIVTQLFFDNKYFYDYCERCELAGINVPIVAGIMPITSISGMNRMAELSPRTNFPAKLQKAVTRADSDEGVEKVGIHWATEQVMNLLDHDVRGIHFYTLNKSDATRKIYESLGVSSSVRLGK